MRFIHCEPRDQALDIQHRCKDLSCIAKQYLIAIQKRYRFMPRFYPSYSAQGLKEPLPQHSGPASGFSFVEYLYQGIAPA
jgi:hypothetical protein